MKKIILSLIITTLLFSGFKTFATGYSESFSSFEQEETSGDDDLKLAHASFAIPDFFKKDLYSRNYQNELRPAEFTSSITTPPPNFS